MQNYNQGPTSLQKHVLLDSIETFYLKVKTSIICIIIHISNRI